MIRQVRTSPLLRAFLADLYAANKAKGTTEAYRVDIGKLLRHFGSDAAVLEATRDQVRDFYVEHAADHGPWSQRRLIWNVYEFYKWCVRRGMAAENPTVDLRRPSQPKRLPRHLDEAVVERLIAAAKHPRDKALIELLYACGLRNEELRLLVPTDVSFEDRAVRVLGKGNKERRVPFGEPCAVALKAYLAWRADALAFRGADNARLFVAIRQGSSMTAVAVQNVLHDLASEAGIEQRIYPHMIRHSFATHMLARGMDIRTLQELMGHSCLQSTMLYLGVNMSRVRIAYDQAHPRAFLLYSARGQGSQEKGTAGASEEAGVGEARGPADPVPSGGPRGASSAREGSWHLPERVNPQENGAPSP